MTFKFPRSTAVIAVATSFLLTACGGSSSSSTSSGSEYNGSTKPASFANLDSKQKQALVNDSMEVLVEIVAINNGEIFSNIPFGASLNSQTVKVPNAKIIRSVLNLIERQTGRDLSINLPMGASVTEKIDCDEGYSNAVINENEAGKIESLQLEVFNCKYFEDDEVSYVLFNGKVAIYASKTRTEITFTNYKIVDFYEGVTDTFIVSGHFKAKVLGNNGYEGEWNLKGTTNDKPYLNVGSVACDSDENCTVTANVKVNGGQVFKVENFAADGDGDQYDVTATIYHPTYGVYDVDASVEEECYNDESPFVGTLVLIANDADIRYLSTKCSAEPNIF